MKKKPLKLIKLNKNQFAQIGFNQYRQKVVYCFKNPKTGKIEAYDNHSPTVQEFKTLAAMKENYENKFGSKKEWFWNPLNSKTKSRIGSRIKSK